MNKKVVIIIATCNQEELLRKNLSSIKKNTSYDNYKVWVIDDRGKDYLSEKTKKEFSWVNFLINQKNEGLPFTFNWGMKQGFEADGADYVALLNDDLEFIEKNWLTHLINVLESYEKIGLVHPKMIYPEGYLQYFYKDNNIQFIKTREEAKNIKETDETFKVVKLNMLVGTCILFKKKVYEEIGGWDMGFSPIYGEDSDWSIRANKKGFKQMYVGNTKVIHYNGSSENILKFSEGKWYMQKAHGIRLEWLNFSLNKIIRLTFIHFGSALFSKHPFKKLDLLFKAYDENFENYEEIKAKRYERNHWEKI